MEQQNQSLSEFYAVYNNKHYNTRTKETKKAAKSVSSDSKNLENLDDSTEQMNDRSKDKSKKKAKRDSGRTEEKLGNDELKIECPIEFSRSQSIENTMAMPFNSEAEEVVIVPDNLWFNKINEFQISFPLSDYLRINDHLELCKYANRYVLFKKADWKHFFFGILQINDSQSVSSAFSSSGQKEISAILKVRAVDDLYTLPTIKDNQGLEMHMSLDGLQIYLVEYLFGAQAKISQNLNTSNIQNLSSSNINSTKAQSDLSTSALALVLTNLTNISNKLKNIEAINSNELKIRGPESQYLCLLIKSLLDLLSIDESLIKETSSKSMTHLNKLQMAKMIERLISGDKFAINNNVMKDMLNSINIFSNCFYDEMGFEKIDEINSSKLEMFREISIKPLNEASSKLCLLLNIEHNLNALYIKEYRTGAIYWVYTCSEVKVNCFKGKAIESSFDFASKYIDFYKYLNFSETGKVEPGVNSIVLNKMCLLSNLNCEECTYQIGSSLSGGLVYCKGCFKCFHEQCFNIKEQNNKLKIFPEAGYYCRKCIKCKNCHSNNESTASEQLICRECGDLYHFDCLNNEFTKTFSKAKAILGYWKCEKCIECMSCKTNMKKVYSIQRLENSDMTSKSGENTEFTWSNDFDLCFNCQKRFTKKEYCVVCQRLWISREETMIECKCRMWIHKECDRILTTDYLIKLQLKKVDYSCPKCRIKTKVIQQRAILDEIKATDKKKVFHELKDMRQNPNCIKLVKNLISFYEMEDFVSIRKYLEFANQFEEDFNTIISNAQKFTKPNDELYKQSVIVHTEGTKILIRVKPQLVFLSFEYLIADQLLKGTYTSEDYNLIDDMISERMIGLQGFIDLKQVQDTIIDIYGIQPSLFPKTFELLIPRLEISDLKIQLGNEIPLDPVIEDFSLEPIQIDSGLKSVKEEAPPASESFILECKRELEPEFKEEIDNNEIVQISNQSQRAVVNKRTRKNNIVLDPQIDYYGSNFDSGCYNKSAVPINAYNSNTTIGPTSKLKNMTIKDSQASALEASNMNNLVNYYRKIELDSLKDNYLTHFYLEKVRRYHPDITDLQLIDYFSTAENLIYHNSNMFQSSRKQSKGDTPLLQLKQKAGLGNALKDKDNVSNLMTSLQLNNTGTELINDPASKLQVSQNLLLHAKRFKQNEDEDSGSQRKIMIPLNNMTFDSFNKVKSENELFDDNLIGAKAVYELPVVAYFSQSQLLFEDLCYFCGSFGDPDLMKSCSRCLENFHIYCIDTEKLNNQASKSIWALYMCSTSQKEDKAEWICLKCKFCYICKKKDQCEALLKCSNCTRLVHNYCLKSNLKFSNPDIDFNCPDCFKCLSCNTKEYCKPNFPMDPSKDYLMFTRNFTYCIECGFEKFYYSECEKCMLSNFNDLTKEYVQISSKAEFIKFSEQYESLEEMYLSKRIDMDSLFNSGSQKFVNEKSMKQNFFEENFTVMLQCSNCNRWFHCDCVCLNMQSLYSYFENFDVFTCLDCHSIKKFAKSKIDLSVISYLETLKKAFEALCFSKMVQQLLRFITKGTNLKLNSRLIRMFLKDHYDYFSKDKDFILVIELVRQDSIKNSRSEKEANQKFFKDEKSETNLLNKKRYFSLGGKRNGSHTYCNGDRSTSIVPKDRIIKVKQSLASQATFKNGNFPICELEDEVCIRELDQDFKNRTQETYVNEDFVSDCIFNESIRQNTISQYESLSWLYNICSKTYAKDYDWNHTYLKLNQPESPFEFNNSIFKQYPIMSTVASTEEVIESNECNNEVNHSLTLINTMKKKKRPSLVLSRKGKIKLDFEGYLNKELESNSKVLNDTDPMTYYNLDLEKYLGEINEGVNIESFKKRIIQAAGLYKQLISKEHFLKEYRKFVSRLIIKVITKIRIFLLQWLTDQILNGRSEDLCDDEEIVEDPRNKSSQRLLEQPDSVNEASTKCLIEIKDDKSLHSLLDSIDPITDSQLSKVRDLVCFICNREGTRKVSGRLIPGLNFWAHFNCIYWSRNSVELDGGLIYNIYIQFSRNYDNKCGFCKKSGATIQCYNKKCAKFYHFCCAVASKCFFSVSRHVTCQKCTQAKGEASHSLSTKRRIVLIANEEVVHHSTKIVKKPVGTKKIPRHIIGKYSKFGNTSIIKFNNFLGSNIFSKDLLGCFIKTLNISANSKDKINLCIGFDNSVVIASQIETIYSSSLKPIITSLLTNDIAFSPEELIKQSSISQCFSKLFLTIYKLLGIT